MLDAIIVISVIVVLIALLIRKLYILAFVKKRPLILLLCLILLVMGGLCTKIVLNSSHKTYGVTPTVESVSSFLITQDQQQLVVVGQQHHYIVPLDDVLKSILFWSGRSKIQISNLNVKVGKNNIITGCYTLHQRDDTVFTPAEIEYFQMKMHSIPKFEICSNYQGEEIKVQNEQFAKKIIYSGGLKGGKVYEVGQLKMPKGQYFNEPYKLRVDYDYLDDYIPEVLNTPLTVAVDGGVAIGAIKANPIDLLFVSNFITR